MRDWRSGGILGHYSNGGGPFKKGGPFKPSFGLSGVVSVGHDERSEASVVLSAFVMTSVARHL